MMALALAVAVPRARAQALLPMPELDKSFNLTTYAASTDTATKEFPTIPDAGFQVALPRTWMERMSLGQDFGEIARFDGPAMGDVRPYFSYKRIAMPRENSARMELVAYALKKGYLLRSIREIDDRNVEALYTVLNDKGDSYTVRALMRVMGTYYLLAEYALPTAAWDAYKDAQTFAIGSFRFLKNSDTQIEKRTERVYFESLKFFYPASWRFVGEQAQGDNRVSVQLQSRDDTGVESGRITLNVISSRSLKDESDPNRFSVDVPAMLRDIRQSYEAQGYDLGSAVENLKPDLNIPVDFAVMDVYNLRRKLTDYQTDAKAPVTQELWIAVFRSAGANPKTYVAELLTPSRTLDLYQWSVNTRAFAMVLKSIQ